MLRAGQAARMTLHGVADDGGDVTIDVTVRRASRDGRAHLDAPTWRRLLNPQARRRQQVMEAVRYDLTSVRQGTVVTVTADDVSYTARVQRGYGGRVSVTGMQRAGPP